MKIPDPGILPRSTCFSFTPPEIARELFFYLTWCGHYYCTGNYFIRRETYPPMLLMYVCQGAFQVEYRGEARKARPGDILLLDCSEPHYYQAEDGLEFLYAHFDGAQSHPICRHILDEQGWLLRRENGAAVGDALREMVSFYEQGGVEGPFESSMRIYRILGLLLGPTPREREAGGPVDEAVSYIRSHVGKKITLDELAGIANLSPFYFSRCFKRQTGFSPMGYVINTRLDQAKILLIRTTRSVEDIAWEVGYASSRSFIDLFTGRIGISPTQFRKEHQSHASPP